MSQRYTDVWFGYGREHFGYDNTKRFRMITYSKYGIIGHYYMLTTAHRLFCYHKGL